MRHPAARRPQPFGALLVRRSASSLPGNAGEFPRRSSQPHPIYADATVAVPEQRAHGRTVPSKQHAEQHAEGAIRSWA